jgi:hypothetical protein
MLLQGIGSQDVEPIAVSDSLTTSMHFTSKTNPSGREDLDELVACYVGSPDVGRRSGFSRIASRGTPMSG